LTSECHFCENAGMAQKATTTRLKPWLQAGMENLSRILGRPMNSLFNDAVEAYLETKSRAVEAELEASLAKLRAYRLRDPDDENSIAAFVEAEAGFKDPTEGRLYKVDDPAGKAGVASSETAIVPRPLGDGGPVRTEINRILNARLGRR